MSARNLSAFLKDNAIPFEVIEKLAGNSDF